MKLLAITAIISGVLVLLGWFTLPVRVALLLALALVVFFRRDRTPTVLPLFKGGSERGWIPYVIPVAAAAAAATLLLWSSGTTDPIRSPWSVVPVPFFFLYALLAMIVVVSTARSSLLTSYSLLLTSSLVAILVYPLGFGFDHFIHAAAERIITTTGALSPPPFFYSGHYGLAILLADLLPGVGVDIADRLLTPLLTICLLVPLAYRSLRSVLPDHAARLGLSSLLIVPFLPLTVSTPQATANVFALATIFLLLPSAKSDNIQQLGAGVAPAEHKAREAGMVPPEAESDRAIGASEARWAERACLRERHPRPQLFIAALTALAALLSQPMTGIIAIAVVAMAFAWQRGLRIVATTIAVLGAAGIPLAFAIAGRIIPGLDLRVAFDPLPALQRLSSALRDTFAITAIDFATADALAVARVLLPILWTGLAIAGAPTRDVTMFSRSLKHGDTSPSGSNVRPSQPVLMLVFAPLIALVAAALVAATVTIPTQLGEEQSQFPLRLVQLAALLATPLAAIGLGTLLDRVRGRLSQTAAAIAVGAAATFTLLLAYPRDDAQARSGLWSVSADDIAAVHAIANDASDASAGAGGDASYVVLANQMLGAAAIREFGFRPSHRVCDVTPEYTNGPESANACREILAFPLPAGGPIARQFWGFVSQNFSQCFSPSRREGEREGEGAGCLSREPIDTAMNLVGAPRAYVVLHDYWRNYERLAATTAAIADAEVGQFPHLRIFRLTR